MSEAQMSVDGRQQLQAMRDKLVEENASHETIYVLHVTKADLEALQHNVVTPAIAELVTRHLQDWP